VPVIAGGLSLQRGSAAPEWTHGAAPTRAKSIDCELVSCLLRLEELEEDWRELWASLSDATPFQSPDWLLPWWKHYGEGQLFSFAFWDGARLVGLAPLQIFRSAADPTRRLFLLGTGNSDYLDVLFHPAWRSACCDALMAEIGERSDCWDVCSFQRLRRGSPLLDEIAVPSGWRVEQAGQVPCVTLDLRDLGHGAIMLRRSQSYARKLLGVHRYSFNEASAATLDEFSDALERLHQQRWRQEGCRGALSTARDRSFHRMVARRFLEAGMLMFFGIRMAGTLITVIYGYRVRGRVYSYLSGFDLECARKSVGAITIAYAVQRAIESGCQSFDFLQGKEKYKYTWGGRDQACFVRRIVKE
jgi:CelD/BcsL family acetyltransferase involved in cellulose biosynthesis